MSKTVPPISRLALVRKSFNKLPGPVKVLIYTGGSQMLGVLLLNINNYQAFDWRAMLAALVGIGINLLAYFILQEKNNG